MRVKWEQGVMFLAVGLLVGYAGFQSDQDRGVDGASTKPEVLATVGGSDITRAEVEALRPSEFQNLDQQVYDLTDQTLNMAIQRKLLALEAEARDLEPAELVVAEIDDQVQEPSDEEIAAFFQERNLQGSLESLTPQIKSYLKGEARNARIAEYFQELESQYDVDRLLQPLRIPVEAEGYPSKGDPDAPVTIVEFSDFQCPYCRALKPTLEQVEENYGDEVRFVFRQFPLTSLHPQAYAAAQASLCARDQDKFWEMHDAMFANQRALEPDQLKATVRELGMDGEQFDACLDSGQHSDEVAEDLREGQAIGINGTPRIFINGRSLSGAQPYEDIARIIDDELRRAGR